MKRKMMDIPIKTIERMSLYRRVLTNLVKNGETYVFSHQLASFINSTPAQVRRDLMIIGQGGSPRKGYAVSQLLKSVTGLMDEPEGQKIAITGIGNLGRAIMSYLMGRRPKLSIAAAFDSDPNKVDRVICGCRCYPLSQMEEIIQEEKITLGIITVPASEAQAILDRYVSLGIKAVINWAPINLQVPEGIFVETRDIMMSIEKAAFFSKNKGL
jgi:redox-sensing transcriptional repressor